MSAYCPDHRVELDDEKPLPTRTRREGQRSDQRTRKGLAVTDNDTTCGAEAAFDDGSPNLLCVRDDRHINPRAADGTTFIRIGKGFMIADPKP